MSITLQNIVHHIEQSTGINAIQSGNSFRTPCPVHQSTDRNLSISDGDTRVLLHCHSHSCDPKEIMEAAGLSLTDVFYEELTQEKQAVLYSQNIIKSFISESQILILFMGDKAENRSISDEDKKRVSTACARIMNATVFIRSQL